MSKSGNDATRQTRRAFMSNAAAAAAGLSIVPRDVLGGPGRIAPSDRVNIAAVGVGGMGRQNLAALSSQNLVAFCDVDWGFVDGRFADIPKQAEGAAKRVKDAADAGQKERAQRQLDGWTN